MMNRTRRMLLGGLAAVALALAGLASAQSEAAKPQKVHLHGVLACIGCDLKAQHGAGAACSVYGHKHGLKTADGKYYTFLENAKSEPLIKGEKDHGKRIHVDGVLFPGTQILEVTEFSVDES